jgi:hypothetical protein
MGLVDEEALALALLRGQNHRSRPSSPVQGPCGHTRVPHLFHHHILPSTLYHLWLSIVDKIITLYTYQYYRTALPRDNLQPVGVPYIYYSID